MRDYLETTGIMLRFLQKIWKFERSKCPDLEEIREKRCLSLDELSSNCWMFIFMEFRIAGGTDRI